MLEFGKFSADGGLSDGGSSALGDIQNVTRKGHHVLSQGMIPGPRYRIAYPKSRLVHRATRGTTVEDQPLVLIPRIRSDDRLSRSFDRACHVIGIESRCRPLRDTVHDEDAPYAHILIYGARGTDLKCRQWLSEHIGIARKIQDQMYRSFGKRMRLRRSPTRDKEEEPPHCHEAGEALRYRVHTNEVG